jgi:NAD(P)H-dependent FMN reductase
MTSHVCKGFAFFSQLKDLTTRGVLAKLEAMSTKILGFCGSLRANSFNRKLLFHACDLLKERGCEINYKDLRTLNIPLYDGDLEEKNGIPEGVAQLAQAMHSSEGFVIACPEYNGGITGVLKNTIDWVSRAEKNPFFGKPVLLVGTSPGWFGTLKSHSITRLILTHLKAIVVPTQVTIPQADKSLDEKGKIKDQVLEKNLVTGCEELIQFSRSLSIHT